MPIVIDAQLKLGGVLPGLTKLQATLDRIEQTIGRINAGFQAMGTNAAAAGSAVGQIKPPRTGGGPSTPARSTSSRPPRYRGPKPPDPFANSPLAGMQQYAKAAASGNPVAGKLFNRYRSAFNGQQRNQSNAQMFLNGGGNNYAALMSNVLSSTRFGRGGPQVLGHHLMSLLQSQGGSQILQSLMSMGGGGAGAAAGGGLAAAAVAAPVALAATAVVAQITAMVGFVRMGMSALADFTKSFVAGGGSPGQAVGAQRLGNAIGSDLAGVGKNLSPYAAARMGLNPVTGPWGDMNYNGRGLRAAQWVRSAGTFDEARRRAELAGDPNLANVNLLSNSNYKGLTSGAGAPNMEAMKASANLGAAWERVMNVVQKFAAAFSTPIIKAVADALDGLATNLEGVDITWLKYAGGWIANLIRLIEAVLSPLKVVFDIFKWITDMVGKLLHSLPKSIREALGVDDADDHKKALSDNTKALNDATQAFREGTFGGGQRATGATPSGLHPVFGPGYRNAQMGAL